MKILVIGGSGVIGSKIVKHFTDKNNDVEFTFHANKILSTKSHHLDIRKKDQTTEFIQKINPDIVIHTSALTNVDLCETNNLLAHSINVDGTANIIEGCKITKSKMVYISTSFVFDDRKGKYSEDDTAYPSTYYGITKFEGEELTRKSGLSYLILRTDQPYCWIEEGQHTNSVLRVIQTLQSGKILKEIVDWYNTPTYVPDFVGATERLLLDNLSGIFHLVGSDYVSRYDWSLKVADFFDLNRNMIKPITADTLNLPAKRVNVHLSNEKLFEKTGLRMMGIEEGLKEMSKLKH